MSADMNQTIAAASLDRMHDIIVPEAPGFFPPTPGWYILLLLSLALLFHVILQAYNRYRAEAYRREALQELAEYNKPNKENALALLSLAKRTGIAAYGRETIVPLLDDAWWDFVEAHSEATIDAPMREALRALLYSSDFTFTNAMFEKLYATVGTWIKSHRGVQNV